MPKSKLSLLLPLFFSLHLHAVNYRGTISSALGGTGVAGIPAAEGALINPASIPIYGRSSFDGTYRDGNFENGHHRTTFALGAIDAGSDALFAGALNYVRTRDTGRLGKPINGELWHAAAGQQLDHFSLGFGVHLAQYDVTGMKRISEWNYDIGALYMATSWFGIGYVLRNIAGVSSSVPAALRDDLQQTLGILAGLGEVARVRFDLERNERLNPRHQMAYALGLETKTSNLFVMRFGYRRDDLAQQRLWSAGFGFDGPRLQMDYAFQKAEAHATDAMHSVDLRLSF